MLRALINKLTAKPAADDLGALPPSVEAAIDGLTVMSRSQDSEGNERTLLHWHGGMVSAWYHTPDETRRRLAAAWPYLSPSQIDSACRSVGGKIAVEQRNGPLSDRKRSDWAGWKPLRTSR
jgi:hypothetical protein